MAGIEFTFKKRSGFTSKSNDVTSKKQVTVFGEDSDEEDQPGQGQGHPGQAALSMGSHPPGKVNKVIEELAQYVAKHGRQYEDTARHQNSSNPAYKFLFDRDSDDYQAFQARVQQLHREQTADQQQPYQESTMPAQELAYPQASNPLSYGFSYPPPNHATYVQSHNSYLHYPSPGQVYPSHGQSHPAEISQPHTPHLPPQPPPIPGQQHDLRDYAHMYPAAQVPQGYQHQMASVPFNNSGPTQYGQHPCQPIGQHTSRGRPIAPQQAVVGDNLAWDSYPSEPQTQPVFANFPISSEQNQTVAGGGSHAIQPGRKRRRRWDDGGNTHQGSEGEVVISGGRAAICEEDYGLGGEKTLDGQAKEQAATQGTESGGRTEAADLLDTFKVSSKDSLQAANEIMERLAKREEERQRSNTVGYAGHRDDSKYGGARLATNAFERRRTYAVMRDDGQKGHHMQDYIPKEELAKFLEKSEKSGLPKQSTAAGAEIDESNIGHRLLQKMGWKQGEGIGQGGRGVTAPISAGGVKHDTSGLGVVDEDEVRPEDDEYTKYRKRMKLGYKYRPNPLGNPRKQYY